MNRQQTGSITRMPGVEHHVVRLRSTLRRPSAVLVSGVRLTWPRRRECIAAAGSRRRPFPACREEHLSVVREYGPAFAGELSVAFVQSRRELQLASSSEQARGRRPPQAGRNGGTVWIWNVCGAEDGGHFDWFCWTSPCQSPSPFVSQVNPIETIGARRKTDSHDSGVFLVVG